MKKQDILIVYPRTDEQYDTITAFLKALKIRFELINMEIYDAEFVQKVQESRIKAKKGMVKRVKKENLEEFLGLE